MNSSTHPFSVLVPDLILDAVESTGLISDFRISPLNSYENRVYQVGIEDSSPVIAKFYRPERWNKEQIMEEHTLLLSLKEQGVPVAAPIFRNGSSLFEHQGLFFCLTPKLIGQHPEAENLDHLYQIGELIGLTHKSMSTSSLKTRLHVSPLEQITQAANSILSNTLLPKKLKETYKKQINTLHTLCESAMNGYWPTQLRPIHGDCHRSNLMLHDNDFHLLDFDDCQNGVAVQDLWLHLTQSQNPQTQLSELIEGYENHLEFEHRELNLIDVFKSARVICYAAWLQNRWHDPAFTKAFPWFASDEYWLNHLNELKSCELEWGKMTT